MSERFRVLIADDHPETRADVRSAIDADGRFVVVAEVGDAAGAIHEAVRTRPDLCLLDVNMPGGGIAAIWEISARLPQTKVVMLTVSADERDVFAALRAGASGYLLKEIDPARLPAALFDVLRGEAALPRRLVARILEEFRDRSPRRRATVVDDNTPLTSREWQVLDLMRLGLKTSEMARRLHLSQATVRSHVAAILRKLRVPDRESAVRVFEQR